MKTNCSTAQSSRIVLVYTYTVSVTCEQKHSYARRRTRRSDDAQADNGERAEGRVRHVRGARAAAGAAVLARGKRAARAGQLRAEEQTLQGKVQCNVGRILLHVDALQRATRYRRGMCSHLPEVEVPTAFNLLALALSL